MNINFQSEAVLSNVTINQSYSQSINIITAIGNSKLTIKDGSNIGHFDAEFFLLTSIVNIKLESSKFIGSPSFKIQDSVVTVSNCTFESGASKPIFEFIFTDTIFQGSKFKNLNSSHQQAIYFHGSYNDLSIDRCEFHDFKTTSNGAGSVTLTSLKNFTTKHQITNSLFKNNTA